MLLNDSIRKLLAARLKEGAEEVFGNQDERNAMVQAMRSGKPAMDTPGGEKLKNLAMGLIFAGPGAKTADLLKLNIAKRMDEAGAKMDEILKQTGWFRGMDGKWKFEISDDASRFSMGPMTGGKTVPATEVLDHPAMYAAYPHLRSTSVSPMPADAPRNTMGMLEGPSFPSGGKMYLGQGARRDTALHEMQHAIQEKEGFAVGGSPGIFQSSYELQKARLPEVKRHLQVYENKASDEARALVAKNDPILKEAEKHAEQFGEWGRGATLENKVKDYLLEKEEGFKRLYKEAADLEYGALKQDPHDRYKALAGEIEARNVQSRMTMNPARRTELPPWMTQDIPPEQAIIRTK